VRNQGADDIELRTSQALFDDENQFGSKDNPSQLFSSFEFLFNCAVFNPMKDNK